jgi:hypothetical protein
LILNPGLYESRRDREFLERGSKVFKRFYEVEFRGQRQKVRFQSKQQAQDYAVVVGGFGSKQYRIQQIIVKVEEGK